MQKKIIKSFLLSIFITLLTSVGYFVNTYLLKQPVFYTFIQRFDSQFTYIFESYFAVASGFPFRMYNFCTAEFMKCMWSLFGMKALIYNGIFWFLALFLFSHLNNQKHN